jgi:hypothetical protein
VDGLVADRDDGHQRDGQNRDRDQYFNQREARPRRPPARGAGGKSQIRNPKSETNPNVETRNPESEDRSLILAGRIASGAALVLAALTTPLVPQLGGIFKYFQTGVTYMAPYLGEWELGKMRRMRNGNRTQFIGPSDSYRTKDGRWVMLAIITNSIWRRFARHIGRDDLANDLKYKDDYARWQHREIVDMQVNRALVA